MTPRTAITRATIAAGVALLVYALKLFGVEVPSDVANNLVEVGAVVAPLAFAWYAARAHRAVKQANARPTEGDTTPPNATPDATAEGDAPTR